MFRNAMKTTLSAISVIRGILAIILLFFVLGIIGSLLSVDTTVNTPITDSFSVIKIDGSIAGERSINETGYDHQATIEYIQNLANNPHDKGILLFMNTPGGTVYHSDEIYLSLLKYKETTGRPVYAYMSEVCASGGYYISMAADYIMANRITMTGSIGVISVYIDVSELFDKLGVRTVAIDTGEHKATGTMGTELTPRQIEVAQAMVDEYYDLFIDLIVTGRNMETQTVRNLADGRVYSAWQALDKGLIDEICGWNEALESFEALTGVSAFYPDLSTVESFMGQLFSIAPGVLPKSDADIALSAVESLPHGVPLAIATELMK